MAAKLKRPILIGGLGLTFGAYIWDSITPSFADAGSLLVWGTVLAGSATWWLGRRSKAQLSLPKPVSQELLTRQTVENACDAVQDAIGQFVVEANTSKLSAEAIQKTESSLRDMLDSIRAGVDRQAISLVTVGDKGVGKTTLVQWLQAQFLPTLISLLGEPDESFSIDVIDDVALSDIVSSADKKSSNFPNTLIDADLILFLVAGDLTESQFQHLKVLAQRNCRVALVFAQADRYLPSERSQIIQKLQQQLTELSSIPGDVVMASIAPSPIKVRKYSDDGTVEERVDHPEPDVEALRTTLNRLVGQKREQLILATALRQTQVLQATIRTNLNQLRHDRAMPIIEEYQWIAAATAFANPVPSLDLIATAAITTQMVVDIGALYKLNFSVDQAKKMASALAELMVKLGLVELASQALSPLLKSNVMTFAAGGTLQGLSAAYLTHVAGISLIGFFEEQSTLASHQSTPSSSIDGLKRHLQIVFEQNQRVDFLKSLIQKGTARLLTPSGPSPA